MILEGNEYVLDCMYGYVVIEYIRAVKIGAKRAERPQGVFRG